MSVVTPLTIDDFERLPSELAENHELVDGELVDVSGNTGNHNGLRDALVIALRPYVEEHKLGKVRSEQEYDFGGNAHGPDVTFFASDKAALYDGGLRIQRFVPDLVIEIVSKNDPLAKLLQKVDRYRNYGTKEAWILDIDSRQAFIFSESRKTILDENGIFESSLIPGFSMRLGDLFDRL